METVAVSSKKPHPWEEPQAPKAPKVDWLFKVGLTAPDVATNPSLWPFRWIYGGRALRRLKSVARGARRVLDIRCGSGWLLWELAKVSPQAQLLGLDTRLRPLIWGQLQSESRLGGSMGKVQLEEMDFLDFQAEDESFDLILCNLALSQAEEAAPVLEKIHRLLKPGGTVYYYEGTEPTNLTVEHLAGYYQRRRRWRGIYSDLWNLRREVRSAFARDSLRAWRNPKASPEGELFSAFQGLFQVMEQGRFRSLVDLWLRSLPVRFRWFWLPILIWIDKLAIASGWLEGCRRYALARKL
ncbi:class I SAM-dependent methyltransferase [bacterium]|nr:class I SAM-dependent methyltransferase [bacterium]